MRAGCIDIVVEIVGPVPLVGSRLVFKGLSTSEPLLEFEDGTTFVGEFQETVGSLMVFSEGKEETAKECTVSAPSRSGEENSTVSQDTLTTLECIQDKKIVFRRKSG